MSSILGEWQFELAENVVRMRLLSSDWRMGKKKNSYRIFLIFLFSNKLEKTIKN